MVKNTLFCHSSNLPAPPEEIKKKKEKKSETGPLTTFFSTDWWKKKSIFTPLDGSSLQKQMELPAVMTIHSTAKRNLFSQLQFLSQEHSIGCDGLSVPWALAAADGLTVKTDTVKLINVCVCGFFLKCKDFRKMFNNSFPACAFFFKVEIRLRTLIPLSRPGSVHSGSASWDDCGWVFPDELYVTSLPDRFPHYVCTIA